MYKIVLSAQAQKVYTKLSVSNKPIFRRITQIFELLRSNPRLGKPLKFRLKGRYSLRVGVYRIIYSVAKQAVTVYIIDIGHRKDIYR